MTTKVSEIINQGVFAPDKLVPGMVFKACDGTYRVLIGTPTNLSSYQLVGNELYLTNPIACGNLDIMSYCKAGAYKYIGTLDNAKIQVV